MKTSRLPQLLALSLLLRATVAQADLIPPGGQGVHACHKKKAGDACENYLIVGMKQVVEPGTCAEEKLDHLPLKFKAHLRCISTSVRPGGSVVIAAPPPSASAAPEPSATPSAQPAPSAAPAATATPSAAPEAPKSSGSCAITAVPCADPTSAVLLLLVGILFLKRRAS